MLFDPPERMPERDTAIEAMLTHVPFDGWTKRALTAGLADVGMPADEVDLLFPGGTVDMVEAYCDLADRWMEQDSAGLAETSLTRRVRAVILVRLERHQPHREAVRRAVAVLAMPANARVALGCSARTVNAIWHAAGDESADFSWYTKRLLLSGVYNATLLFWLRDGSDNMADTKAFLDRRLSDIGRLGATVRAGPMGLLAHARHVFAERRSRA
jgi:ubiquinone biosynthesis protein COQ9